MFRLSDRNSRSGCRCLCRCGIFTIQWFCSFGCILVAGFLLDVVDVVVVVFDVNVNAAAPLIKNMPPSPFLKGSFSTNNCKDTKRTTMQVRFCFCCGSGDGGGSLLLLLLGISILLSYTVPGILFYHRHLRKIWVRQEWIDLVHFFLVVVGFFWL